MIADCEIDISKGRIAYLENRAKSENKKRGGGGGGLKRRDVSVLMYWFNVGES